MSRNRSSSLPPATATPGGPLSDHLRGASVMQGPLLIARSISAESDAPTPPPPNCIESCAELGPIRKRSVSDPTSVVRVSTNPPDGATLSGSRDEDVSSSDGSSVEDAWDAVCTRDAVRRYHALKELLATEYSYLEDLRFLVTVYLRNLPTLVVRSLYSTSTFASFTTGPSSSWMHSSTSHASSITGQSTELQNVPTPPSTSPYHKAPSSRFLFTDSEVELLTRNGEEILQLHEQFVEELCMVLEPLGFSRESDESEGRHEIHVTELANVNEAIRIVSTKFSTEASRFNIYQTFCAGHPEAMDALRKAVQQFPVELDIFEHRSSSIVSEELGSKNKLVLHEASSSTQKLFSHNAGSKSLSVHAIMPPALEDRKRTLSLTSLDDRKDSKLKASSSPKSLKLRASMTAMTAISITSNSKEKGDAMARLLDNGTSSDLQRSTTTSSGGTVEATKVKERDKSSARKIAMADYMIKPVQRICKYPLLLDQLLPSKALRVISRKGAPNAVADLDAVVETAARAMRHVAASVDAARERQSIATQSSLIFSRICLGLQVQGTPSGSFSHSYSSHAGSPPHPSSSSARGSASTHTQNSSQSRLPTPTFLSSLGPCLLSGLLDVIHYSHPVNTWSTGAIKGKIKMKAKYLGAFLYVGYLIFVKAGKGKRYEPKHWFALDGWDIVSIDEEEAMLPHSFRLSKAGQHFELAASCLREKDVWLASISEALKHVPALVGEPIPSFMCDGSKFIVESTPPSAPGSDDGHSELVEIVEDGLASSSVDVAGLPTICSIPNVRKTNGSALESESRMTRTEPFFTSLREHVHGKSGRKKRLSTISGGGSKRHPQPPQLEEEPHSRRSSSSTSVMSIFLASHDREKEKDRERETETVLITRSSATARQAIDFELQDVISASCASARADAAWREKVDVGPGAGWGSTKAKTSSSMAMGSMSRGMAILSKHESVRVPRKRTSVTIEALSRSVASSASTKRTSGRKNAKKLSLTSFSFIDYDKSSTSLLDESESTSTNLSLPQNSSAHAAMGNLSVMPISATFISVPSDNPSQMKRSRSFVQNVKDLFHIRPGITAPVSVIVSHPTQSSLQSVSYMDVLQQDNKDATNTNGSIYPVDSLLKTFTKDSGRPHGKNVTEEDEIDFVTITSIHEADENVAKDKFSIAMPVMTAPMVVT